MLSQSKQRNKTEHANEAIPLRKRSPRGTPPAGKELTTSKATRNEHLYCQTGNRITAFVVGLDQVDDGRINKQGNNYGYFL